jgi:GNAT superfamily N-acetyltransferase
MNDTAAWVIRRATPDDAMAMAVMHVRAWQVAYRGIVPDPFLDTMDVAARAARYTLDRTGPGDPKTWIAVDGDRVLGGLSVSRSRDEDEPDLGEVRSLYVHPDVWGTGVGRSLMVQGERLLVEDGFVEALLWVLEANPRARRFYEIGGWRPDGARKTFDIAGREIPEIRYRKALWAPR